MLIYFLIALLVLYLLLILPRFSKRKETKAFLTTPFAHRGLHDKEKGIPENSLAAFKRAVDHGYGMELDLHLSKDGKVFVMHDDSLLRTCGVDKQLSELDSSELFAYRLEDTEEKIPMFSEVLDLVEGKTPLLIEVKPSGKNNSALCEAIMDLLSGYHGAYMIESFDPRVLIWFRKNAPNIIRGQLSQDFSKSEQKMGFLGFVLTNLFLNIASAPDFIAYHFESRNALSFNLVRYLYRTPVFFWTIRSKKEQEKVQVSGVGYIFEHYLA